MEPIGLRIESIPIGFTERRADAEANATVVPAKEIFLKNSLPWKDDRSLVSDSKVCPFLCPAFGERKNPPIPNTLLWSTCPSL